MIRTLFDTVNTYRLHVVAAYLILLLVQIQNFNHAVSTATLTVLGSFSSLLFGTYLINKYFDYDEDIVSQPNEARRSQKLLLASLGLIFAPAQILFLLAIDPIPYLFFVPIAVLYCIPFGGVKLKSILFLKNIYAAGSWWLSAIFIIVFYTTYTGTPVTAALAMLPIFLIVMVFELLWDIRDMRGDAMVGTQTVPVVFGLIVTKGIMLGLLLSVWAFRDFTLHGIFLTNLCFLALMGLLAKEAYSPNYFHAALYAQIMLLLILFI